MEQEQHDYIPGQWDPETGRSVPPQKPYPKERAHKGISIGFLLSLLCFVAAVAVFLTYTLTVASERSYYAALLKKQQDQIEVLQDAVGGSSSVNENSAFEKLELFSELFELYGYYSDAKTEEEILDAVLKAYAEATGDTYAEYYTEKEYLELMEQSIGDYEGIGVSVIQTTVTVDGYEYQVFQVISIYENAPAASSDLQIGDCIYAVLVDGTYQTISALGGYTIALSMIRGESGTDAEFAAFRPVGDSYTQHEFCVTRGPYESQSVRYYTNEQDPEMGVVYISNFDLTTPNQFKSAVNKLLSQGVKQFVFDVRNNPGGDLQSIKAVLTYFLQEGDLILSAIDRNGKVANSYYAEAMTHQGIYESCDVAKEEIGMYADLDMVVICNQNTASAAEVFVATLRDYGLATTVGQTTFGKGIMQTTVPLSSYNRDFTGYVKMTTYAYVTKCGITYHEIGIVPNVEVALSEEASRYNLYVLPQALDNQLQAAFAQFQ